MPSINFSIPNPSVVTLKVYNMLGQEVATLIDNQVIDEGDQDVTFDGSNLASGIYFYRLVAQQVPNEDEGIPASTFVTAKKMMLLK